MTFYDSIKSMTENLVDETLNSRINWSPKDNTTMVVQVDDVTFSFSVNWKLELKTGWTLGNGWITIKSDDFDYTVYSHDFPDSIKRLREYLYNEYFFKYKPSDQDTIDKVDNITKKISINEYRDKKITDILNYDKR